MHQLGHTRSSFQHDHLLHTPDAFVRAPLPQMQKATAIVHTAPAAGAGFMEYTAEFEAGGSLAPASVQRFVYVLEGELTLTGAGQTLAADGYVYLPAGDPGVLEAQAPCRAVVIEKPYETLAGVTLPQRLIGSEQAAPMTPLMGDPDLEVRTLLTPGPSFDFAVNTMTFRPGAALSMVEIHVMEHGLLMLKGGGIYRLGEHWYPVTAGDFIYMAPFCPQWFGALGKTDAKYLIYKDWNRHPLA